MSTSTPMSSPVKASAGVHELLSRLHEESLAQEAALPTPMPARCTPEFDTLMRDKLIALESDKCQFVYQLLRAQGGTTVVEAGTSFGVSTIYLALAVQQNWEQNLQLGKRSTGLPRVIATENEPAKAAQAQKNWDKAGGRIKNVIELREGDLRVTLRDGLGQVDFLLLDIWAPLAFPTLKTVEPSLRPGAIIVIDNTISFAAAYGDLLSYVRGPETHFRCMTLPFHNGLDVIVYDPEPGCSRYF